MIASAGQRSSGAVRTHGSPIPSHCPYRFGDWVRRHGKWGALPPCPNQWGWRGYVTGSRGGTILCGVTDDGFEWWEEWGALEPDTPRPRGRFSVCTCCPRVKTDEFSLFPSLPDGPPPVRRGDLMWWRQQYGLPTTDLFGEGT
jgi:hypothetical protein